MNIRFYNTLTHKIDPFDSLEPGIVRMYSCGPTVYDYAHIGNFRSFLFGDLLRRFLERAGYDVMHVMNITDVGHMTGDDADSGEDRMVVAQRRLKDSKKSGKLTAGEINNPDDPFEISRFYAGAYLEDARRLGMKIAFEPEDRILWATEHIAEMQAMIKTLLERDHAYVGDDGVVYYSVESFPAYGDLSGNTLDKLREGEGGRVLEADQACKRHPGDFLLWKPDRSHIMKWDSPWGVGYPGWHIECSVMAQKRFERDTIDIHTGGEDLIFPHHECEIAQSCGASGKEFFARFWMHARFLLVEGEKMSKSAGNFFTVRDVLSGKVTGRPVHPSVLRYELTKSHYRANMNFTSKGLVDSAAAVRRMVELEQSLAESTGGTSAEIDNSHVTVAAFLEALADDLNVSKALAVLHDFMRDPPKDPAEALAVLRAMNDVLNVAPLRGADDTPIGEDPTADVCGTDDDPDAICKRIDEARASKDFATADELRKQLVDAGYEVRTGPEGTSVKQKLA